MCVLLVNKYYSIIEMHGVENFKVEFKVFGFADKQIYITSKREFLRKQTAFTSHVSLRYGKCHRLLA